MSAKVVIYLRLIFRSHFVKVIHVIRVRIMKQRVYTRFCYGWYYVLTGHLDSRREFCFKGGNILFLCCRLGTDVILLRYGPDGPIIARSFSIESLRSRYCRHRHSSLRMIWPTPAQVSARNLLSLLSFVRVNYTLFLTSSFNVCSTFLVYYKFF